MSPPTKALEVELWKPGTLAATAKTVPEYFRSRYGKASGVIAALIRPIPLIGLTEGQFVASAAILSAMLGAGYYRPAPIVVAVEGITYSVMGGLWPVTMTDFTQVFLTVIGMAIAIPFALNTAVGAR